MDDMLSEVLVQVQSGRTSFAPKESTQDGIAAFQRVAAAVQHANEMGYVSAVFQKSKQIGSYGSVLCAVVTSPLSYKGLQYLESPAATSPSPGTSASADGEVILLRPNIGGFGIDLRAAYKRLKRRLTR